jgi:aldehyde dehydrogenase (NAD(P)+)
VGAVREKADEWARLDLATKRRLLDACKRGVETVAADWVAAACRAKGLDLARPAAGEEWLAGPSTTVRNLRLLDEALGEIAAHGRPRPGVALRTRADGRVEADVFPSVTIEKAMFAGFSAKLMMQPGWDERRVRGEQASFYQKKDPTGAVSLVLGAGNVSSIPPMDVLYKMYVEGEACVLKMNPVNEYVGPFLERAFAPLVERGYLAVVYGGGDVGAYLCQHPAIADVHITGSDRTHDLIVWGPPGPERERRKQANDPVLKKRITSELGNVSPVMIVPASYRDDELWFQARNVASMVTNNASFNCNAAKILVTSSKWPQRDTFRKLVAKALGEVPPRKAYYPGAHDRYQALTEGRKAERFGQPSDTELAWALIPDVDASRQDEPLFRTEPFCGILSETALDAGDPVDFLVQATRFCNDRLWGTLNAAIVIHPSHEHDPSVGKALDRAVCDLRYGSVGINHWPALAYAFVTPTWGGHPSATLADIQSGLGWVHNTFMFEGVEKAVVRGPLKVAPKPVWFYDNRETHHLGAKMVGFEATPSWWKVPGMALLAMRG